MISARDFRKKSCYEILAEKIKKNDFSYSFGNIIEYRNIIGNKDKRVLRPCDSCQKRIYETYEEEKDCCKKRLCSSCSNCC